MRMKSFIRVAAFCALCLAFAGCGALTGQIPAPSPLPEAAHTALTQVPASALPSPTAAVSAEPTSVLTDEPTAEPTALAAHTDTPKPTDPPRPTGTPKPMNTPKPTRTPKPAGTPKPTNTPWPAQQTPAPLVTGEPGDITLMFVGDLMCLSGQQYAAMSQAGGGGFDFTPSFKYVKGLLKKADCAFGNLETALSHSAPYSYQEKYVNGMPNCNGPKQYLDALGNAGFDALALANNHCCDAGRQGIIETVDAVEESGLYHTGLFKTHSAKRYRVINVNGIKVGFISYAEFYNGQQGCVGSDTYMLNTYSKAAAARDIAAARAAGAEFIVVYEHWGREHTQTPTDAQRKHARELANAGADLICGSHSHTVQPSVWLTADDGRRVLCFYSLGNFVSSMSQEAANDTVIAEVGVKRSADGRVSISGEAYHPARVIRTLEGKAFVVMPTSNRDFASLRAQLDACEQRVMRVLMKER